MSQRLIVFEPNDLLRLITHYTDGAVPLNGQVRNVAVSTRLPRWIGLEVESDEWANDEGAILRGPGGLELGQRPLHIRYEGKKIVSWGGPQDEMQWRQANETPSRQ